MHSIDGITLGRQKEQEVAKQGNRGETSAPCREGDEGYNVSGIATGQGQG